MRKEVVHVTTQEEFDYVISKIENQKDLNSFDYEIEKENTCINLSSWKCSDIKYYKEQGYKIISFNEFKLRYELKIGDTFEHNGFVCRVESEVKKWYLVNLNGVLNYKHLDLKGFCKYNDKNYKIKLITNKEFIKQLDKTHDENKRKY